MRAGFDEAVAERGGPKKLGADLDAIFPEQCGDTGAIGERMRFCGCAVQGDADGSIPNEAG